MTDHYPHLKALAADLWDTIGNERERERAVEARSVLNDAAIADRVRSIVSSVGKIDPEWTPAVAYEQGQERLLLFILTGSTDDVTVVDLITDAFRGAPFGFNA